MFENKDYVFVHFPKTGGTSVGSILEDCFGFTKRQERTHSAACTLINYIADRRVLGSMRSPRTWYESRINYAHYRKRPLPFIGDHKLDFIETSPFIRGMVDKKFLEDNKDVVWRRAGTNIKPFDIMRRKRIGFMTFEFLFTYCRNLRQYNNDSEHLDLDFETDLVVHDWIVTEEMTHSFEHVLHKPQYEKLNRLNPDAMNTIRDYKVMNQRPNTHVKSLSAEDLDIIQELDGQLIAFHDQLSELVAPC